MKILVTGSAGFIGYHTIKKLLRTNNQIIGIDNLNNYYDVNLKKNRLKDLYRLNKKNKFNFSKIDITNSNKIKNLFKKNNFDIVINLAAQAGVRFSLQNPYSYLKNNIIGFFNILDCCKIFKVKHLIFASTSSVYGNSVSPFSEKFKVDKPEQFYASTKISNEVMAYSYSRLYSIKITGLRFFTVYGPWGRPDMALFKFTKSIINNEPIQIYNEGNHSRSFTYIDDIVHFLSSAALITDQRIKQICGNDFSEVFNLGNPKSHLLSEYIFELEKALKKESKKDFLPLQPGDVLSTLADISKLKGAFGDHDFTDISVGVQNFVTWYQHYYSEKSN